MLPFWTPKGPFFVSQSYINKAVLNKSMAQKVEYLMVRVTKEQKEKISNMARTAGFKRKSDYVRSLLFKSQDINGMIKEIYDKVVNNG